MSYLINIYWDNVHLWCQTVVQFLPFVYSSPVFPNHLLKKLSFSLVHSSLLCHELVVHWCVGLFLGYRMFSIDFCVWFFIPKQNLWNRESDRSSFCLFLRLLWLFKFLVSSILSIIFLISTSFPFIFLLYLLLTWA